MFTPLNLIAALLTLIPFLAAAFWSRALEGKGTGLPTWLRITLPAAACIPYILVSASAGIFRWHWLAVYALVPVAVAALLFQARAADPEQRGNWRDFLVLAVLGLAVDLRWFEPAWPPRMAIFSKMLLLETGIYGFIYLRQLTGIGFDLRLRRRDWQFGLIEFALYTPIAIILGLALGFLHLHARWPQPRLLVAWIFTFLFVAVPEELFFRGWMQNLLERRVGRNWALAVTAILFGLSHFNKRAAHFNWQYVLLAAIAGIYYGRAWRMERRVGASAITHATVDTVWGFWLR